MAYASLEDVVARLEGEVTEQMESMILAALEDATDLAVFHGRAWIDDGVPAPVSRIVARSVARWMRNPDGFAQSRAADETLQWEGASRDVEFTPEEVARIKTLAKVAERPLFASANVTVRGLRGRGEKIGYVPVSYGGDDFPWIGVSRIPCFRGPGR